MFPGPFGHTLKCYLCELLQLVFCHSELRDVYIRQTLRQINNSVTINIRNALLLLRKLNPQLIAGDKDGNDVCKKEVNYSSFLAQFV